MTQEETINALRSVTPKNFQPIPGEEGVFRTDWEQVGKNNARMCIVAAYQDKPIMTAAVAAAGTSAEEALKNAILLVKNGQTTKEPK